jgi:imidazole glycerol-phosphate synthase subunit HisH
MAAVTIIDSGVCNLGSIARALERAGGKVSVAADAKQVAEAGRLLIPGVGSFPAGMKALEQRGLGDAIRRFAASGKPLMGICLGMQLLFDAGEEFEETQGLGLIPGRVREIRADVKPHMGWNRIEPRAQDPLLAGLPNEAFFYFVHSFVCEPADRAHVLAETEYEESFCSVVGHHNIRGIQAHPEKSQQCGARLIENFLRL